MCGGDAACGEITSSTCCLHGIVLFTGLTRYMADMRAYPVSTLSVCNGELYSGLSKRLS